MASRAEVLKYLIGEDAMFRAAEQRNPLPPASVPSAKQRTAEAERLHKRGQIPKPAGAKEARLCKCENPQTYVDEDSELRCLCGSAAR